MLFSFYSFMHKTYPGLSAKGFIQIEKGRSDTHVSLCEGFNRTQLNMSKRRNIETKNKKSGHVKYNELYVSQFLAAMVFI